MANPQNVTLLVPLRPPYHCPACLPVYRDYVDHGGLSRHLRRIHGGRLNFECRACGRQSDKLKELKLHQARSTQCSNMFPSMSPDQARDPKQRGKIPTGARRRLRQTDYGLDEAYLASQAALNSEVSSSHPRLPTSHPRPTPAAHPPTASPPPAVDTSPAGATPTATSTIQDVGPTPTSTASDTSPTPLVRRPRRRRRRKPSDTPDAASSQDSIPDSPADSNGTTTAEPSPSTAPHLDTNTVPEAATADCPQPPPALATDPVPRPCTPASHPPEYNTSSDPPSWVLAWRDRFNYAVDEDMLETMVDDLTCLAQSMTPQQHRPPHRPNRTRPARSRNNNRRGNFNPAEASRLQRLYRANKHKAFEEVTRGASRFCSASKAALTEHFSATNPAPSEPLCSLLPPRLQPTTSNPLHTTFTPTEVAKRLTKCHNTAPGPDGIRYYIWRRLDPQGHILSAVFNAVQRIGHVPSAWKTSTTILLHKKGDPNDIHNWRPIALANTLGKIYSACLANRLLRWCEDNEIISNAQKGFMRFEGCSEHSYVLQSTIQHARRKNGECHVAWLDLRNAFGSVPHSTIYSCLKWCGLDEASIECVQLLLEGCHTRIRSNTGLTDPIPVLAGVKQGCPLSPILFNLVIEPAIRLINSLQLGYRLHEHAISILAYADDITIVSGSASGLQSQLDLLTNWALHSGLTFNPAKCATLSVAGKYQCSDSSNFRIQNSNIPCLGKNDSYHHLGIPTGFTLGRSADSTIDGIIADIKHIDNSPLAPWQKIDCVSTFLTSRLTFHLTLGKVHKKRLSQLDTVIKRNVKKWMNLPQRASPEIVYIPHAQGGANVTPCNVLADVAQVSHAINLIQSKDPVVATLATKTLQLVVEKRIKRQPTEADLCTYLAGSMDNEFGADPYDIPSTWTRLRMATRRLKKRINIEWSHTENGALIPTLDGTPIKKTTAMKSISAAVRATFLQSLLNKPDQGKAFKITSANNNSNHFLREGNFTRFADWRFIHRARLSVVPLRGLRRFGNASQTCRRCQRHRETLAHVINHCPPNLHLITKRHNAILDRLNRAFNHKDLNVYINQQIPDFPSSCRPDLVVINQNPKTATIVDIATPFENGADAFERARSDKIQKYEELANHYRRQGYDTFIDAFVVGSLGGYDSANDSVLQRLGVSRNYAKLMRKLMVSDCIRWSRDIYARHLGHRI
ncbi:uncharacterized protein LOC111617978 [Centruroides sculpturatus]|uniref:uncharacterized protein LOC111617978 n=1 Tax=Centruroides sculpturatus TaxID=218467 RepID=UPI000C6DC0FE|nr:uncharacterized protein LOC111617978 [Centruroides sculpturatus]